MQQEAKITAVFTLPDDTIAKARAIVDVGTALERMKAEFPDATFAFAVATLRPRAEKAGQAQQDGATE